MLMLHPCITGGCKIAVFSHLRRYLPEIAIVAAMIAVGGLGWWLSPLILPASDVELTPQPGCDLHRAPCVAMTAEGRIELAITPRPVPIAQPFRIEVRTTLAEVRDVAVDFDGETMRMGYNRPRLKPVGDGLWRGEGILPVCITGPMLWRATVLIETAHKRYALPVRFDSNPPAVGS